MTLQSVDHETDGVVLKKDNGNSIGQDVSNPIFVNSFASGGTSSITTPTNFVYDIRNLLNGTNKKMDVNGSSIPVDFKYLTTGNDLSIESISFIFAEENDVGRTQFANLSSLSNGFLVSVQKNSVVHDLFNLKDNMDIATTFTSSANNNENNSGFIKPSNYFIGRIIFGIPIFLDDSLGDFIRARVRDNLNALEGLEMRAQGRRQV